MAKKDNSPAISFFSFQDIITSITGIMFLVVMMLVLLVVSRTATPTAEEREADEKVAALQRQLDELKAKTAALTASRDDLRRRVDELKQLDLASLAQKKAALIRQMEQLAAVIVQEKTSRIELEKTIAAARAAEAQLQTEISRLTQAQNEVEKLLKESSAEKESLTRKIEHSQKLVRFVWRGNTAKKPLIAVCSKEMISIQDGLSGKSLYSAKGYGNALTAQLLEWCRNQEKEKYYLVLLVKPSAFEYAGVLSHQLSQLGFERGWEILPTEELDVTGGN